MPKRSRGEQCPADSIGNAVKVVRIAIGEETEGTARRRASLTGSGAVTMVRRASAIIPSVPVSMVALL
jgi:hypothetical protein